MECDGTDGIEVRYSQDSSSAEELDDLDGLGNSCSEADVERGCASRGGQSAVSGLCDET
jgi:hypothetical protein